MYYKEYFREFEEKIYNDLIPSTDNIMYSNARAMEIYGQGKRFKIEDNLLFYEVIKVVRDVIDKHFYQNSIRFYTEIANKEVTFTFVMDMMDIKYSYFLETLYMFITSQLFKKFGDYFEISREDEIRENNEAILKINVKMRREE